MRDGHLVLMMKRRKNPSTLMDHSRKIWDVQGVVRRVAAPGKVVLDRGELYTEVLLETE